MSTGWVSDSGSLLHSPTVPWTVWYGYAFASSFSYVPLACWVSSSSASTSAPEAARSRAVPAGSGLSAPTLWLATVRSLPGWDLSLSSPPKRFSHTMTGSSSATTAEAERRHSAPASSTGMNRPNHGRKVSTRLPRFPIRFGIFACSSMSRPSSSASAASTGPRFQGPGREPMRIARRMPARQDPAPVSRRIPRAGYRNRCPRGRRCPAGLRRAAVSACVIVCPRSLPVTAASSASSGPGWGRHTSAGNHDRSRRCAVRSARVRSCRSGTARTRHRARTATPSHRSARCRPRPPTREETSPRWPPIGRPRLRTRTWRPPREEADSGTRGTPAAVDVELDSVVRGSRRGLAEGLEQTGIEVGHSRNGVIEDRHAVGDDTVGLAERTKMLTDEEYSRVIRPKRTEAGLRHLVAEGCGDHCQDDQQADDKEPANPAGRCSC